VELRELLDGRPPLRRRSSSRSAFQSGFSI
jgi:hypothetical protein